MEEARWYMQNGASEILFALQDMAFSALPGYSAEELNTYIEKIHAADCQCLILMDRLLTPELLAKAVNAGKQLAAADGFVFGDAGLLRALPDYANKMIYRPLTLLTNTQDACWWGKQCSGVWLADHLNDEECLAIVKQVPNAAVTMNGRKILSVSARNFLGAYEHTEQIALQEPITIREVSRTETIAIHRGNGFTCTYGERVNRCSLLKKLVEAGLQRAVFGSAYIEMDEKKKIWQEARYAQ